MPLCRSNTRVFHRTLFGGQLQTVTLLKRGDDLQEGTVRTVKLFECLMFPFTKAGEQIMNDISVGISAHWLLPGSELKRVGVLWLNSLDRIVDRFNRWWQPEADVLISIMLFENYYSFTAKRVDPYPNIVLPSLGRGGIQG